MLKSLSLENFRNYEKYSLNFAKTTILIGPNGIGKTNIIEAIYLLSTGRSWRTSRDNQLIKWDNDVALIKSVIKSDKETEIEIALQRIPSNDYPKTKFLKINGVKKRLIELLGRMPTVLFSPEEIQLIEGTPSLRRRFLDILLCNLNRSYALNLIEYLKVLKGRNKLLYYLKIGKSKLDEMKFWDEKLVTLGSEIISKREELIRNLNANLTITYEVISGEKETLQIKYKKSVEAENFRDTIIGQRDREVDSALTLFGPHRDDLIFLLDNRDISTFGSRGEYRSVILALKIEELAYLKKNIDDVEPILLLDDIFSELDATRRLHLAKIISGQQTIITTTDFDHIEKGLRDKAKIVELK